MPHSERLKQLQNRLLATGVDALIVENKNDLYYLTGLDLSAGALLLTPRLQQLFVDGRYYESCREKCPCPVTLTSDTAMQDWLNSNNIKKVGFDTENTSYKRFLALSNAAGELVPLDGPVKPLRAIKETQELHLLRAAADLGCRGYDLVVSLLKEGVREQDLAQELEIFWLREGGQGLAFDPIIAFGPNSSKPHYRAGDARLASGQPVLIDIGVTLQHYHSDMTRVVFFGPPQEKLLEIYAIVLKAQEAALAACKPGITTGELDRVARDLISAAGFGAQFTHSLGHGVGLDIHEFPTLRNHPSTRDVVMEAGMVITIEPGIYLPGLGGVRLEDTVVITETGCENLTPRSKEPRVLA